MNRENQYFRVWQVAKNVARGIQAVDLGHTEIQDGHIRLDEFGLFYRLSSIARLGYNCPIRVVFNDGANASSKHVVVICNEETKFRHLLPLGREPRRTQNCACTLASLMLNVFLRFRLSPLLLVRE